MKRIPIYAPKNTPRLHYVLQHIATFCWDVEFYLITKKTEIYDKQVGINFSKEELSNWFKIKPNGPITENAIDADWKHKLKTLDSFSYIFFGLSRYEEYLPFRPDKHNRFGAKESAFYPNHRIPQVDRELEQLRQELGQFGFQIRLKPSPAPALFTFDIDQVFRDKHLGKKRMFLSTLNLIRKRKWQLISERAKTLNDKKTDAFDCFPFLKNSFRNHNNPYFFWHLGKQTMYDSPNIWNTAVNGKIQSTKTWSIAGLHPSYRASSNEKQLAKEVLRFSQTLDHAPIRSRQHYIKLQFPSTYKRLILQGIKEDYSMGYADDVGFRAGTAKPFLWYDLTEDTTTDLRIFPFCAMDVSLKHYLQKSDEEAEQMLLELFETCRKYNGVFIPIFHNQNLVKTGFWKEWRGILKRLIDYCYA